MARKNHIKGRRPQARRRRPDEVVFTPPRSLPKPPPVEQTIIPHGRCPKSRKLRFHRHEVDKALKQAQALRRARGQEAHMEQRYYECKVSENGCGDWHLTSRAEYIQRPTPERTAR